MLNLIPKPAEVKEERGFFKLEKGAAVYSQIDLPLVKNIGGENSPVKIYADASLDKEEYRLSVGEAGIVIKASDKAGAYYALQSVRMLGRLDEGKNLVPFVEISDKPQYKWRGQMLDVSRHFFDKAAVKDLLDDMFRLKLNVFHWHLSDDQGWRIEIKKYPKLTEIGSKRSFTQVGGWGSSKTEDIPHGGYYTQEDIKEIVEYAARRCISIVPEIDVPAHFAAALAAYPHLACRNIQSRVFGEMGGRLFTLKGIRDWNRPACLGKKESLQFIFDVYDEVCGLFPFEYFHVGGDEADVSEWKKCPDCQKAMKEMGFANERELQKKLTNELCEYLKSKGKHMIAWNDVLRQGTERLDTDMVVQQWLPGQDKHTRHFAEIGGKIIMSNHKSFYFDMTYAQYPLKNTYAFKPSQYGINDKNKMLGVEGEMWTEWVPSVSKMQFMLHPRMEALAEVAWTPESSRDFNDFRARYEGYKSVYKQLGINFAADSICMPKNLLKRAHIRRKFTFGDPDLEFRENNKQKEK
ncbi:MAG: hypothetical protein EGQ73_03090 [Clostridiales bacterium]|nr:hypothetical protein [Clostridiales bacterium]